MSVRQKIPTQKCPLCQSAGSPFYKDLYFLCFECFGIFMNRNILPTPEEEKRRYKEHNNDINDPKYQAFVAPITSGIFQEMTPEHSGLDFGSGTGPVISKILKDRNYSIRQYDPFFGSVIFFL